MSEQWPHFGSGESDAGPNEAGSSSTNGAEPDAAPSDLVTAIEEARAATEEPANETVTATETVLAYERHHDGRRLTALTNQSGKYVTLWYHAA